MSVADFVGQAVDYFWPRADSSAPSSADGDGHPTRAFRGALSTFAVLAAYAMAGVAGNVIYTVIARQMRNAGLVRRFITPAPARSAHPTANCCSAPTTARPGDAEVDHACRPAAVMPRADEAARLLARFRTPSMYSCVVANEGGGVTTLLQSLAQTAPAVKYVSLASATTLVEVCRALRREMGMETRGDATPVAFLVIHRALKAIAPLLLGGESAGLHEDREDAAGASDDETVAEWLSVASSIEAILAEVATRTPHRPVIIMDHVDRLDKEVLLRVQIWAATQREAFHAVFVVETPYALFGPWSSNMSTVMVRDAARDDVIAYVQAKCGAALEPCSQWLMKAAATVGGMGEDGGGEEVDATAVAMMSMTWSGPLDDVSHGPTDHHRMAMAEGCSSAAEPPLPRRTSEDDNPPRFSDVATLAAFFRDDTALVVISSSDGNANGGHSHVPPLAAHGSKAEAIRMAFRKHAAAFIVDNLSGTAVGTVSKTCHLIIEALDEGLRCVDNRILFAEKRLARQYFAASRELFLFNLRPLEDGKLDSLRLTIFSTACAIIDKQFHSVAGAADAFDSKNKTTDAENSSLRSRKKELISAVTSATTCRHVSLSFEDVAALSSLPLLMRMTQNRHLVPFLIQFDSVRWSAPYLCRAFVSLLGFPGTDRRQRAQEFLSRLRHSE